MRTCSYCDRDNHTAFTCPYKPRKPLKQSKGLVATKRMNKTGKVARQWINTRTEWFRLHPADHYDCYICGKYMLRNATLLDHVKSRTRHPELRYDLNNLAPICHPCNEGKGSLDLDEYLQRRKEFNGWD